MLRDLTGKTIKVRVNLNDSVEDLRNKLVDLGYGGVDYKLVVNGNHLISGKIGDYLRPRQECVIPYHVISMVLGSRGGKSKTRRNRKNRKATRKNSRR